MKKYLIKAKDCDEDVVRGSKADDNIWMALNLGCDYVEAETEKEAIDLAIDLVKDDYDYYQYSLVDSGEDFLDFLRLDSGEIVRTYFRAKEVEV